MDFIEIQWLSSMKTKLKIAKKTSKHGSLMRVVQLSSQAFCNQLTNHLQLYYNTGSVDGMINSTKSMCQDAERLERVTLDNYTIGLMCVWAFNLKLWENISLILSCTEEIYTARFRIFATANVPTQQTCVSFHSGLIDSVAFIVPSARQQVWGGLGVKMVFITGPWYVFWDFIL